MLILQDPRYLLLRKCPALEWLSIRLCPSYIIYMLQAKIVCPRLCNQQDWCAYMPPNLTAFEYRGGSKWKCLLHLKNAWSWRRQALRFWRGQQPGICLYFCPTIFSDFPCHLFRFMDLHGPFVYLRHLTVKITFSSRPKRFGKNAILQLAYLLEAAPFLVDLHLDVRCYSICTFILFAVASTLWSRSLVSPLPNAP